MRGHVTAQGLTQGSSGRARGRTGHARPALLIMMSLLFYIDDWSMIAVV